MIKDIYEIYSRNLFIIILLSVIIIAPVTALNFISILFLNEIDGLTSQSYIAGFLLLINYVLCAPPFLKMVLVDMNDESMTIKEGFLFFIIQFGPLLINSVLLYLIAVYTMWLFFVPTLIILMFLLIIPYYSDVKSYRKMMKNVGSKLLNENLSIVVDFIIVFSLTLLIWGGMVFFMQNYQSNIYGYMLIRVTLNILTLPIIYIYLSLRYRTEITESYVRGVGRVL